MDTYIKSSQASTKTDVEMMHDALDKVIGSVINKGFNTGHVSSVTITKRWNSNTGHHVHASCVVKMRFDESVHDDVVR